MVADTHIPKRAGALPASVWAQLDSADVLVHAGDRVNERLLDACEARAPLLLAVWGNNDHDRLRERLPEVARPEIEGVRFGVVHETGPAKGREERCSSQYPDLDVLVFGHSHGAHHDNPRTPGDGVRGVERVLGGLARLAPARVSEFGLVHC